MRFSYVVPLVAVVVVAINGCGKIPTWSELTEGNKPAVAEPTPPPAPPTPPPAPVIPKGPTAEEIIAQFKALRPGQVTDADINRLTNLTEGLDLVTEINADGSTVSKDAFGSIEKLTNLRQLRLNGTRVNDETCAQFAKVTSLEVLALSGTTITDVGVAALTSLVNLKQLEMSNCRLTLNGFAAIGMLPALESLSLTATNLDNRGMREICKSTSLTTLFLNDNQIDDDGLEALKKLKNLEHLHVASSRINGSGLQYASKQLKSLSVNRCNLDDRGGKAMMQFKSMERLNLGEIPLLNDFALHNILKGMKNLKYLNLSRTKLFNGEGLDSLASCKDIEEVYIDQCPMVGDKPVIDILKSLKSLKRVRLGGTAISAAGIQRLKSESADLEIQ